MEKNEVYVEIPEELPDTDSPGFHVAGIWKPLYWLWTLQFCLSHMYLFYYAGYFL
ncbi:MAG: hypothetical protein ACLRH0_06655 [Blautia wexlerae]